MTFQELFQKVLEADIELDTDIVVSSSASLCDEVVGATVSEEEGIVLFY